MLEVRAQERRVEMFTDESTSALPLSTRFPRHTQTCHHVMGSSCQFEELCFSADQSWLAQGEVPLGFVPRTPHHEPELIQIQGGAK